MLARPPGFCFDQTSSSVVWVVGLVGLSPGILSSTQNKVKAVGDLFSWPPPELLLDYQSNLGLRGSSGLEHNGPGRIYSRGMICRDGGIAGRKYPWAKKLCWVGATAEMDLFTRVRCLLCITTRSPLHNLHPLRCYLTYCVPGQDMNSDSH